MAQDHRITCTLCGHQIAEENLSRHRKTEAKQIRDYTIGLIKRRHPEWNEAGDVCTKCWDLYREL